MSSFYWSNKARKYKMDRIEYENFKSQIETLLPKFDEVAVSLKQSSEYLNEVVINGKPYDYNSSNNNRELQNMAKTIMEVKKNYQTLCSECEIKIKELSELEQDAWDKYHLELEMEKQQREARDEI